MMDTKKQDPQSCGCGCDLKKEVNELVKEGTEPTQAQHEKKKQEVEAAFKKEDNQKK